MTNQITFYLKHIFVLLALAAILLSADKRSIQQYQENLFQQTFLQLSNLNSQISSRLYQNIHIVRGIPSLFRLNPSLSQSDYEVAMKPLIGSHTDIRNIAVAPGLIIKYMYPIEGNEQAIGLDYRKIPAQFEAVKRALTANEMVLAGPIKLVQGGQGLIARIPITVGQEAEPWGIVSTVIDVEQFFSHFLPGSEHAPLTYAVRGKDGLGAQGDIVFGDISLFKDAKLSQTLAIPGGEWQLVGQPTEGWAQLPPNINRQRLENAMLALLIFIFSSIYFYTRRHINKINHKFRLLIEKSTIPCATTSVNEDIIYLNPAFTASFGYSIDDISTLDDWWSMTLPDPNYRQSIKKLWRQQTEDPKTPSPVEAEVKCKDGQFKTTQISITKLDDSRYSEAAITFIDITESKELQRSLEQKAHYDDLTKLPNRVLFTDRFQLALAHSNRSKNQLAICFLDLDNFKPVNDEYGHSVGDQLLVEVSRRIKNNIRDDDTVSRLGGDEFALILNDITSIQHCQIMLDRVLKALSTPIVIDGREFICSSSIGFTVYPEDNGDVDQLLRHADQAMYTAKLAGKNRHHLFNVSDNQQVIDQQTQLDTIRSALANHEFCLFYQPKVNMSTGKVIGAEALIRWNHPVQGLIPPGDFLPVIRDSEMETHIGCWVMNEALRQLDLWQKEGIELQVSINISSRHLLSKDFFQQLEEALNRYPDVNPRHLQLEILESSMLGDIKLTSKIISSCRNHLGVEFALDDFGTGYSSLAHLRNLSVTTIKIDQSFIHDILDDANDITIIDGVINLANAFNCTVIAEGVETTKQGMALLLLGCVEAQGYGIAKPMPADEIKQWLNHYQPMPEWQSCTHDKTAIKERKIEFYKLISRHWFEQFTTNIMNDSGNIKHWPSLNKTTNPAGMWLNHTNKDSLFNKQTQGLLKQNHDDFYQQANTIHALYQQGEITLAREQLIQLEETFVNMQRLTDDL